MSDGRIKFYAAHPIHVDDAEQTINKRQPADDRKSFVDGDTRIHVFATEKNKSV